MMEKQMIKLPVVALRGMTVLPEMVIHFDVSRTRSIEAVQRAMQGEEQKVFLVTQREIKVDEPEQEDLYEVGTIAKIKQIAKMSKNIMRVLVVGGQRARLHALEETQPCLMGAIEVLEEAENQDVRENLSENIEAKNLKQIFFEYTMKQGKVPKDVISQVSDAKSFSSLIYRVACNVPMDYQSLQDVLDEDDLRDRYSVLAFKVVSEMEVIDLKAGIHAKVKERMEKHQKEFLLREQMKVIREELGEENILSDAEEFEQAVEALEASEEVKQKLQKEIKRFKSSQQSAAENGVIRTYIETMLDMPWDKKAEERVGLSEAKDILEAEHYGLEKVKERILEFLAVRMLTQKGDSPILCLVGPPGTGKTSIAKSLAKALGKPYARISLGGVRDEAEIRGHRKTYVGAMPGRIANALKSTGVKNPLLLLDEIDKVSNDYKGDTFSALLEVLDGEQNMKFRDHYLEVPMDLSEVLFVTTANSLQTIPRPLLDRMEVIEVSSYTENEKLHIATQHLIPKQLRKHGLTEEQLQIHKNAIWKMARNYTREAGVRQLERMIGELCRKTAREILEKKKEHVRITQKNLEKYLGKEKFSFAHINESDEVGIVRGLAWTSVGGDTLEIEVNLMPGKGEILLTGQLGDVMKESARTGISFIRSVGADYQVSEDFFEKHDIHIHIPEGAVPKDGPSAGITMATAMISAITGRKVRADVAMTGEITLRGRVLPIGGLKEKLLAAKVAGVKRVLVPQKNLRDAAEITMEITNGLEIIPVSTMEEVLKYALVCEEEQHEDKKSRFGNCMWYY